MSKYLIFGKGYIGSYLANHLPNSILVSSYVNVRKVLLLNPDHILINCAGKTGRPNIDWCEDHKSETFDANVSLPIMIAEICKELGRYWMHIGSGCIYNGYEKDFTEADAPNFLGSFYSKTKYWSQEMLTDYDEVCVLRIRMPIDENLEERCYISKIVKYARQGLPLFNLPNSMTVLTDLVEAIKFLSEPGEFNVVNNGTMTIGQILRLYKCYIDPTLEWTEKKYEDIELKAERSNCVILPKGLEEKGFIMPELNDSVIKILERG